MKYISTDVNLEMTTFEITYMFTIFLVFFSILFLILILNIIKNPDAATKIIRALLGL